MKKRQVSSALKTRKITAESLGRNAVLKGLAGVEAKLVIADAAIFICPSGHRSIEPTN